ncbi:DEAD/DEAH box helicase family protein [Paenibacillus sp. KR2-11]|uniref:DEAD/DEAH box helicase family protein n=1 Tax=Paenibacillus sp. KR2-11 TaxID=3385500 RepID=UPI0038FBF2E3
MPNITLITENLADQLIPAIGRASAIYIMTSFVMNSGVRILAPYLREAAERGAEIKVLGGDYLFVTQPEGLRSLIAIHPRVESRMWRSRGTSFHPKAYLLDYDNSEGLLIVGSSNLSHSAFRMGMEWNLAMNAVAEPFTFQEAFDKFMRNFYHESTFPLNEHTIEIYEREYNSHHQKFPELVRTIAEMEESELQLPETGTEARDNTVTEVREVNRLEPRPAQQAALEALQKTMEEQYDKAMVVMATGLGKTYLAGFFAQRFRRVLFIAHREEILYQAQKSFQHVMPERSTGIFNGQEKTTDADCIFASIYTLGIRKHRETFDTRAFDLIVVDEFHHAAARSYQSVIEYFEPAFLLGITATPDRMDGQDVYAICDGNVAYQLHFIEAIERGWLSPFRYYGVHDETDYSQITWLGSRYDEEELLQAQMKDSAAANIYRAWQEHKQTRTLVFCSSIRQADFLCNYFRGQGATALSLHSRTTEMTREQAIPALDEGRLEMIFTVDLFNEGVDIPSVDTLLFVRPTESLTVFTQQVGRGLRLHKGKEYCSVIDLIGNYRNADIKLSLFRVDEGKGAKSKAEPFLPEVPAGCFLQLDTEVIDLLKELLRKRQPRKEKLRWAYFQLKAELGRRPTYLELHLQGRENSREYAQEFKSYAGFLSWADELTEREQALFERYEDWLREVESTVMAKSYKMIVLLYMLSRGKDQWTKPVTPVETAAFFHSYLTEKEYRKKIDFSDSETLKLWDYNEEKTAKLIAKMPMTKWAGSSKGLVRFDGNEFSLQFEVNPDDASMLHAWTEEICLYRLHQHFERRIR